jgi:uncharacterized RDD family membrane protein YckC
MSDEELVEIYKKGTLTEIAIEAINDVFRERGLSIEKIETINNDIKLENDEHLASLGNRFVAQIFDSLIALFLGVLLYFVGDFFNHSYWIAIVGYFGYYLFSDGLHNGQSLGKRTLNIAVVNTKNGKPCGYIRSAVRNLSLLVLGIIDIVFIFGKRRQRLGDLAADTEVINLPHAGSA